MANIIHSDTHIGDISIWISRDVSNLMVNTDFALCADGSKI
jgi:hypothetical protein